MPSLQPGHQFQNLFKIFSHSGNCIPPFPVSVNITTFTSLFPEGSEGSNTRCHEHCWYTEMMTQLNHYQIIVGQLLNSLCKIMYSEDCNPHFNELRAELAKCHINMISYLSTIFKKILI